MQNAMDVIEQSAAAEFRFPILSIEGSSEDSGTDDSDVESLESAPILTPSSSCMSLESLYYSEEFATHSRKQGSFTGRYLEDALKASQEADEHLYLNNNEARLDFEGNGFEDHSNEEYDLSSGPLPDVTHDVDKISATASDPTIRRTSIIHTACSVSPSTATERSSSMNSKRRWDPAFELERARLRFSRHRHRVSELRTMHYPKGVSMLVKKDEGGWKKPKLPWKTFITNILWTARTYPGSETEPIVVYGSKYLHREKDFQRVNEEYEKRYHIPGSFRDSERGGDSEIECLPIHDIAVGVGL